jgi:hypothetical protein
MAWEGTMAEPARRNADGPSTDDPERQPAPRAADVRRALITEAEVVALAAAELAGRPDDDRALAMLRRTVEVFEILGQMTVREVADEADWDRGYATGYAACKAERCRLAAVPDA